MKTFFAGIVVIVFVAVLSTRADDSSSKNASGPCSNVACDHGRMCVVDKDDSTVCVCPDQCSNEYDPVCSVYNRSYNNTCEMHKFACQYGFFTAVESKGLCTNKDSEREDCPIERLLDFHERYLAWLQIAYNEDHNIQNKQITSMDSMSDEVRIKLIEFEFSSRDINKNDHLDPSEVKTMVDDGEPCMVALIKACDYDGTPGISQVEWKTCFPSKLEEHQNNLTKGEL